jgi:hypothetical protein
VSSAFTYQGVLEESGRPVNGDRQMVFRLYTDASCSDALSAPLTRTVALTDGLFSLNLPLDPADANGQALYLETAVAGVALGCQPILPVPYALSLRPGAVISGAVPGGRPALSLNSRPAPALRGLAGSGTLSDVHPGLGLFPAAGEFAGPNGVIGAASAGDSAGYGVVGLAQGEDGQGVVGWSTAVTGTNTGVYGRTDSPDGSGGWFENTAGGDDIVAGGSGRIRSVAPTVIAVHPYDMVKFSGSDVVIGADGTGVVEVRADTPGFKFVYVPVDNPLSQFGVPQLLDRIRVCYRAAASNRIDSAGAWYTADEGFSQQLVNSFETRSSTAWECFEVAADEPLPIDGPIFVRLVLEFDNTTDILRIGKLTLTLVE